MTKNKPQGWSIKKLGDICTMFSGGTPSTKNRSYWENGTIRWLSAKHLENDKILSYEYITQEGLRNSSAKLAKENDIILVTRVSVGKMLFCEKEYAINQDLSVIRASDYVVPKYLFFCLKNIIPIITHKSQGLAIKGITKSELANIPCVIPPIAEQEKIAGILGTWDRAIEELADLITEKKELKRGLMQRLLTGIQRLPGFTKPWKKIKLSDVLEECVETTTTNNQYEILTSSRRGIFRQEDYFDKQVASQDNIGYKIIRNGDFTYRAMTDDDKFCFNQLTDFEIGIVSPAYAVFRTKKIPGNILKFILNSERFGYELLKEAQGGTRKSLKYNSLIKLQIYVPDDEEEMARLSECLHIADSEIDLLNQQLDVLREQKRGLMQKLLTGEIRVKVDTETC